MRIHIIVLQLACKQQIVASITTMLNHLLLEPTTNLSQLKRLRARVCINTHSRNIAHKERNSELKVFNLNTEKHHGRHTKNKTGMVNNDTKKRKTATTHKDLGTRDGSHLHI